MSSKQNLESEKALETNRGIAQGYYGVALPALKERQGAINASLAGGEPSYLSSAFQGQRGAITEGLAQQGSVAQAQQMAGAKGALSGGNPFASLHPADIGAQLANALYGSRFAEGQANIDQQFNLMGMALGGAGTTGNAALGSAQQQLGAIQFMPQYNQTYANVAGGLAGAAGIYGAYNNQQFNNTWNSLTPYAQMWGMPTASNSPATLSTAAPGMGRP